jgi:ribosomal protein S18 acetylase RimI-like enzyme
MTTHDLASVLALWSTTEGVGLNESDTPEQLRAYLVRNPGLSLVARKGQQSGATAGLLSSVIHLGATASSATGSASDASIDDEDRIIAAVLCGHDGRRGYLHHLAVLPEFRHRGLGRQLVEACLRALATQGILKCNIFLFADNEPGEKFWTRCAWSPRAELQILQRPTSA